MLGRAFITIEVEMNSMKYYGLPSMQRKYEKEVLISDGRGGYLLLPSDGILRRKYHALWVVARNPPFDRYVILSGLRVYFDGELVASQLATDGSPAIMACLEGGRASLVYRGGLEISFAFSDGLDVEFSRQVEVEPLLAMRHMYEVNRNPDGFRALGRKVERFGMEVIFNGEASSSPKYVPARFEIDMERGEEFEELLFSPGRIKVGSSFKVRLPYYSRVEGKEPEGQTVVQSSNGRRFILAGYPWFGVWVRDALISIPGLLTVRGRYAEAREVMLNLLSYEKDGELPEYLDERTGSPSYTSVDSTLWLTYALRHYLQYTDDLPFAKSIMPALRRIVSKRGRRLLEHGPATWMDVRIDGKFLVDRSGMAVEVEALWIDLLDLYERICKSLGEECEVEGLAPDLLNQFERDFWNGKWYRDTLKDDRLRPNQLVALALLPLERERARSALAIIWEKLVTPFGVRTLSPDEPGYRGRYGGDLRSRDLAYHNGTAWPWLSGFLSRASVKYGYDRRAVFKAAIEPLLAYMQESFGCIPEVFDGDAPHRPDGCVLQSWSVAEVLRAYNEDYLEKRPRYWERWSFKLS